MVITPDSAYAFLSTNSDSYALRYLISDLSTAPHEILVGEGQDEITITPDGSQVVVVSSYQNKLTVIDTNTLAPTDVPLTTAVGISITLDSKKAYITNDTPNIYLLNLTNLAGGTTQVAVGDSGDAIRFITIATIVDDPIPPPDPSTEVTDLIHQNNQNSPLRFLRNIRLK